MMAETPKRDVAVVLESEMRREIDHLRDLVGAHFEASKELTNTKFDAALAAVTLAGEANEKRFESVNYIRQTLTDQNSTFVRSSAYDAQYKAIVDKVDLLTTQVTTATSRLSGVTSGPAFLVGVMSTLMVLVIAVVSGAIQLGSLQTHVSITSEDVARLKADETSRIIEHAGENVERGNFQTRQTISEKQIDQLQDDERQKLPTLQGIVERLSKLEVELKSAGTPK
jgi:hypothetical protein